MIRYVGVVTAVMFPVLIVQWGFPPCGYMKEFHNLLRSCARLIHQFFRDQTPQLSAYFNNLKTLLLFLVHSVKLGRQTRSDTRGKATGSVCEVKQLITPIKHTWVQPRGGFWKASKNHYACTEVKWTMAVETWPSITPLLWGWKTRSTNKALPDVLQLLISQTEPTEAT